MLFILVNLDVNLFRKNRKYSNMNKITSKNDNKNNISADNALYNQDIIDLEDSNSNSDNSINNVKDNKNNSIIKIKLKKN
jgi:hypothetical protein